MGVDHNHIQSGIPRLAASAALLAVGSVGAISPQPPETCSHDNYLPLDDIGGWISQLDSAYPFYFEAASDFMLTCSGEREGPVQLDAVRFAVTVFDTPDGLPIDPATCWDGFVITVYEDAAAFCGAGYIKGPAGEPYQIGGGHLEYCPGSVVCEIDVPFEDATVTPLDTNCLPGGFSFEVSIEGLSALPCLLEPDHKFWIAPAVKTQYSTCGGTAIMLSELSSGQPDQLYFEAVHGGMWYPLDGNDDACPPTTPPEGTYEDYAVAITAVPLSVLGDLNDDDAVDATDLAILLSRWGPCPDPPAECPADLDCNGVVNAGDLAILLGSWS